MEITREELFRKMDVCDCDQDTSDLRSFDIETINYSTKDAKCVESHKNVIKRAKRGDGYTKEDKKLMEKVVLASLHGSSTSMDMAEEMVDKAFFIAQEVVKRFKELNK